MTIVITGATGQLGHFVIESLLAAGVPAGELVAGGRSLEKLAPLAERGVDVRVMDYNDVDSLRSAFAGAEKVLLISGSEVGQRARQHGNVITAAKDAGVQLIAYTSLAHADTTTMLLAGEHQQTERLLQESGLPFVLLRNGWYIENYTDQLASYLERGAIVGSSGTGRISGATRADFAAAAAAVLLAEDQAGKVYELGGDEAFTAEELAAEISDASGTPVQYHNMPAEAFAQILIAAGLPEQFAGVLADSDAGMERGELFVPGNELSTLTGRPTISLRQAVRDAVAATR